MPLNLQLKKCIAISKTNYRFLTVVLLDVCLPAGVGALKFLSDPPFAMIGYMGMNVDINCSTNDPNATVTLLHQASFLTWVEKTVTPNELILTGQVFKLLDLVVSDGGRYNCKATDGTDAIRWPTFKGMLVLKPGELNMQVEFG